VLEVYEKSSIGPSGIVEVGMFQAVEIEEQKKN